MTFRLKLFSLLLVIATLSGCSEPLFKQQSNAFSVPVEINIYGEDEKKAQAAANEIMREFDRIQQMLHAWKPSEISRLNAAFSNGQTSQLSPELGHIIAESTRLSEQSSGAFNPAIGRLIELWGFHRDDIKPVIPSAEAITTLVRANPRMTDISTDRGHASSKNPATQLDLGSYSKGYALDRAAALLRSHGIRSALVTVGDNMIALGERGTRPWKVGIQHPRQAGPIATIELYDGESIVTSGDYRRFFEQDGKRYSNIIDPVRGNPVQGMQAVTVLAKQGVGAGARSNAASHALFVKGVTRWRETAEGLGIDMAMLIDEKGEVHITEPLARRIEFRLPKPVIHELH